MAFSLKLPCAVFLMVCLPLIQASKRRASCFDGWTRYGNSCYVLIKDLETWQSAQLSCQTFGANLVQIDNEEENHFVGGLTRRHGSSITWIGLNDLVTAGHFKWVFDRQNAQYLNFDHGQPQFNTEHCVATWLNGKWHDHHCFQRRYFICEVGVSRKGL